MGEGSEDFDQCSEGGSYFAPGQNSLQPEATHLQSIHVDTLTSERSGDRGGAEDESTDRAADWKTQKAINQPGSLLCHISIDPQWSQWAISGSLADLINRHQQEFTALRTGIMWLRQITTHNTK